MELKRSKVIDEMEHMMISQNMDTTNATGGIERIRRTPIPIAYALHLKEYLFIFIFNSFCIYRYNGMVDCTDSYIYSLCISWNRGDRRKTA